MSRPTHLAELQYAIMRVLWDAGEATVTDVQEALRTDHKDRALTTVATMLKKMEKKGVVGHRAEGRQYVYFPAVEERDVQRSMVSDLCDRLFQGDMTALVSHLLTDQEIDASELARLRALIEEREDEDGRPQTDA